MEKDTYRPAPSPWARPGTQSLKPAGTGALGPAPKQWATEVQVERAIKLLEKLEQRIELLMLSAQQARLPMAGIELHAPRHELTPDLTRTIVLLSVNLKGDANRAQSVVTTIVRYQGLCKLLQWQPGVPAPAQRPAVMADQLESYVYHLGHLPEQFKDEPMLARIFQAAPAAPARGTGALPSGGGTGPLRASGGTGPLRLEGVGGVTANEAALRKAQIMVTSLAPRMQVAALALEALEHGKIRNVAALLTPQGRMAQAIAASLQDDKPHTDWLRSALDKFNQLQQALKAPKGSLDLEMLRELVLPLGELPMAFKNHALLRDLFKPPARPA